MAGTNFTYDDRGNLTSDVTNTFAYTSENLLKSISGGGTATLAYDPAMRLFQVAGTSTTRFAYDGINMAAEYNGSDVLQRRYVFDPTTGQPVIWYEGTGTASANQRYLSQDERGSVISVTDSSGASLAINGYDEYGIPAFGALANQRFGYTGQAWLADVGVQYSRARMYTPTLGRFMQPDPLGYGGDGPNLYAYTLNDPVNFVDPLGLTDLAPGYVWCGLACTYGPEGGPIITGSAPISGHLWFGDTVGVSLIPPQMSRENEVGGGNGENPQKTEPYDCFSVPPDPTSQNLRDEIALFDQVAAISDIVALSAGAAAIVFPPAATIAIAASGFSLGANAMSAGFSLAESYHTGDASYALRAGAQFAGGFVGGQIGSKVAFGVLGKTQLRISGRFGPNAFKAYGKPIERGAGSLGSAVVGTTCHE